MNPEQRLEYYLTHPNEIPPSDLLPLLDAAQRLKVAPKPALSQVAAARLEQRLMAQVIATPNMSWFPSRVWQLVAACLVVIFMTGATTAWASADSLPGEPLYPIKRLVEAARLSVSTDKEALRLELAATRMDEFEALLEQQDRIDAQLLVEAEDNLNRAARVSDRQLLQQVQSLSRRQLLLIEQAQAIQPDNSRLTGLQIAAMARLEPTPEPEAMPSQQPTATLKPSSTRLPTVEPTGALQPTAKPTIAPTPPATEPLIFIVTVDPEIDPEPVTGVDLVTPATPSPSLPEEADEVLTAVNICDFDYWLDEVEGWEDIEFEIGDTIYNQADLMEYVEVFDSEVLRQYLSIQLIIITNDVEAPRRLARLVEDVSAIDDEERPGLVRQLEAVCDELAATLELDPEIPIVIDTPEAVEFDCSNPPPAHAPAVGWREHCGSDPVSPPGQLNNNDNNSNANGDDSQQLNDKDKEIKEKDDKEQTDTNNGRKRSEN